jgi:hypothetical protein
LFHHTHPTIPQEQKPAENRTSQRIILDAGVPDALLLYHEMIYNSDLKAARRRDKYRMRAEKREDGGPVFFVILDLSPVPFVDSTGVIPSARS